MESSEIIILKYVCKLTNSGFWQTIKVVSGEIVSSTSFISLEDSNTVLQIVWVAISRKTNHHVKKQEIFITLFEK